MMKARWIGLVLVSCAFASLAVSGWTKDSADVAAAIVKKVDAASGHQHPEYYTGKHDFLNEGDLVANPGGPLKKGQYLMSWLVLDPPIVLVGGGGAASMGKDLLKEYTGISEEAMTTKNTKNWPQAGQKATKVSEGIGKNGMWWVPINFHDLVDAKQGPIFASGNQLDWTEWGGQGLNQFHEYLFCLAKWNAGGKVAVFAGSDDPEQTYFNGVKVVEGLADRDWGNDQDKGEATVPAGEWVPILAEVGENGGECGYTLRTDPPPSDVTLNIALALPVHPESKATTTWGVLKAAR